MRTIVTALFLVALAGCQSNGPTLNVNAVDGTFRRVADRHDAYVAQDPALDDLHRRVALRDTALLRSTLDAAKRSATTQPTR
jgi:hypothetical protein